jgi:hypothetical protein
MDAAHAKPKTTLHAIDGAPNHRHESSKGERPHSRSPYRHLGWMGLLHLPLMYFIMFTMVDSMGEIFHNLNTLYMAGMMVAPMIILMPLLMSGMYQDKRKNLIVYASASVLFVALFLFMRNQTFVGDRQFLRSMIPHHSGAVLMCERAKLQDPEILDLCQKIIQSQKAEIDQMRNILAKTGA